MKKRLYIIPRTAIINAGIENFIMGSLVNDGNGNWHQTIGPDDEESDEDPRAKYGFWDL